LNLTAPPGINRAALFFLATSSLVWLVVAFHSEWMGALGGRERFALSPAFSTSGLAVTGAAPLEETFELSD
jgi:hypothetical protein